MGKDTSRQRPDDGLGPSLSLEDPPVDGHRVPLHVLPQLRQLRLATVPGGHLEFIRTDPDKTRLLTHV